MPLDGDDRASAERVSGDGARADGGLADDALPDGAPGDRVSGVPPEELALALTLDSARAFAPRAGADAGRPSDPALAVTMDSPSLPVSGQGVAPGAALTLEHHGRYRLGDELGRGGMGRVVVAFDEHLGREVALKELHAQSGGSKGAGLSLGVVTRFLREARVTGQLEHPGIVPVYELGRRADGTLYYTMKRIRGRSLKTALSEAEGLEERLKLLAPYRHVCEAMAYAHSRGVVHRDLKPENIMVGEFGETLLVDWGLSKVRGEEDPRAGEIERRVNVIRGDASSTIDGHAIGTPAYMSPEQGRGDLESIDERSDVWGLGAILFEILTGGPPHTGDKAMEVLQKVLDERPPKVRDVCPEAPPELAAIADRALLRDPSSRYSGAAQLAAEITAFQDGRQVHAYDYTAFEMLRRFVRRHRAASLAALTVLALVIVASALVVSSYRGEQQARAVAEARRDEAVEQRSRAEAREEQARVAVAEALLERAQAALDDGDPGAAALYAAGALARDPANDRAGRDLAPGSSSLRRANERVASEVSAYLDAEDARRMVFVRTIEGASSRGRLSPDGHTLVFPVGAQLVVEALDGSSRRTLELRADAVLGFLDRERVVLAGAAPGVYRLADGALLHALPPGSSSASLRDGRLALGTRRGEVVVLDAETFEERARFDTGHGGDTSAEWTADGEILIASRSQARLELWPWPPSAPRAIMPLSSPSVDIALDPTGGRAAVALADAAIAVVAIGDALVVEQTISARGVVTGVRWASADVIASAEDAERLVLRNVTSSQPADTMRTPRGRDLRVESGGLHGYLVALPARESNGAARATVFRWERERQRRTRTLDGSVRSLAVDDARSRVVVATLRAIVALPMTRQGLGEAAVLAHLPDNVGYPMTLAVARDGAIGLVTSVGAVLLLEPGAAALRMVEEGAAAIPSCAFGLVFDRAGDVLFSGAADGRIRRYWRSRGRALQPLEGHEGAVCGLSLSPDGDFLASASLDGSVRSWDPHRGARIRTFERVGSRATDAAYSVDGERLAVADDEGRVVVLSARSGRETARFQAHDARIHRVAWSADGRRLITAAADRTVRVFAADGSRILRVLRTEGVPLAVDVSSRGNFVFHSDTVHLVRLSADSAVDTRDPASLLRVAEARAGMYLDGLELRPR